MIPTDFWIAVAEVAVVRCARFIPASKLAVSAERETRSAPIRAPATSVPLLVDFPNGDRGAHHLEGLQRHEHFFRRLRPFRLGLLDQILGQGLELALHR